MVNLVTRNIRIWVVIKEDKIVKERSIVIKIQECQYEELTAEDRILVDKAKDATNRSYSPYSSFSVGACVLLDNGVTVIGCNQENAAYSECLCAERTAIFSSQVRYPDVPVTAIAIAARDVNSNYVKQPVTPCGSCRQVMLEHEQRYSHPIRILMVGEERIFIADSVNDLLPLSFDDEMMK